jgi:hypothetical protein
VGRSQFVYGEATLYHSQGCPLFRRHQPPSHARRSVGTGRQGCVPGVCPTCGLTPRSRRGPTALHLAREAPWYMMRFAGQAQYRRSRLNSNVRQHKRGSAVLQQGQRLRRELNSHEAAAPKEVASREPEWPILVAQAENRRRTTLPFAPVQQAAELHWSRRTSLACRFGGLGLQVLHAAVSTAAAGFSSGGCGAVQSRGRQGSPARSGKHSGRAISMRLPSSNPTTPSAVAGCCLTPRSRGAPTAGHQARPGGTLYIFTGPGLASCRWCPLSSNVRPHTTHPKQARDEHTSSSSCAVSSAVASYGVRVGHPRPRILQFRARKRRDGEA